VKRKPRQRGPASTSKASNLKESPEYHKNKQTIKQVPHGERENLEERGGDLRKEKMVKELRNERSKKNVSVT